MMGFGQVFESEAIPGALPKNKNNPQRHPLNLYTEQLSGSSFTRPRANNLNVWMYRILPSVKHAMNQSVPYESLPCAVDAKSLRVDPNVGRWNPPPPSSVQDDFLQGLRLFGQTGSPLLCEGLSIYTVCCFTSMRNQSMSFNDGNILFVPQAGIFVIQTELGELTVGPLEICSIPRGVKFSVRLESSTTATCHRGYLVEVYNEGGFKLPELGVIGANGLANPLHFQHPVAKFDHPTTVFDDEWHHVFKLGGEWFQHATHRSPFDVVAFRGNLLPFKYDLTKFCPMGALSFDHPDPSIFTVLTVPLHNVTGLAALDFVVFPVRWLVAQDTFRPPYFHRNCMSEFMGLISGKYDGKQSGFTPGGASLHNRMQPHGPDVHVFDAATSAQLQPVWMDSGLAFMFETPYVLATTEFARKGPHRQSDYEEHAWGGFTARATL